MIDINLVPQQQRKRKKMPQRRAKPTLRIPRRAVVGVSAAFVGLLLLVHVGLQMFIMLRYKRVQELEQVNNRLAPQKAQINGIVRRLKMLQAKTKDKAKLVQTDDLHWARILNVLSDLLPRGTWLNRLTWRDGVLLISGSAVTKDQTEIHTYAAHLKENEVFAEAFDDVSPELIETRNIQKTTVADFTIKAARESEPEGH